METAFHNILSGKGQPGKGGTGVEMALDIVSSQDTPGGLAVLGGIWVGICSPAWGEMGICTSGAVCLRREQIPHWNTDLKSCSPSPCLAEIYRIVSQRQITGQPESEFGPSTSIEPIQVLPTQQEGRQAPCCQNI